MNIKATILSFISAVLPALGMTAQMTLHDCLVYAREHAHANVINRLENRKAQLDKRIASAQLMPYISFSSSGNISFGRNIDPETNTYDNRRTLSTGFSLGVSLPLFDGLVSVNNLKAARVAELRRIASSQIAEDQISLKVISAFYNISYCKAMVKQMRGQLQRDSIDLETTVRQEQLGAKSGADVAEMQALVASDRYELTNQKNLLDKAYLDLRGLMGMELTSAPLVLLEEDTAERTTVFNTVHPKVAEAQLDLRMSTLSLRAARGAYSPKISLEAGVSTSYYRMLGDAADVPTFREQWHNNMGQYIGVFFSLPIFTGLSTTNKLKRAKIEVSQSRERLEQTIYEVEKETAEAKLDYIAASDEMQAAARRLDAEEIAYRAVRRKFEIGGASALDLYASGAKLATARANYEGKRIQKIINGITLDYFNGKKLID